MQSGIGSGSGRLAAIFAVGAIAAGLTACAGRPEAPKIVTESPSHVTIVADLRTNPGPLARMHCAKYQKRSVPLDAEPAAGNLLRGWAVGTKVFVYTYECM